MGLLLRRFSAKEEDGSQGETEERDDPGDQVEAVHADVRDDTARARLLRVHLPRVALVERLREVDLAEAPLLVLQDDLADFAERAGRDEVARGAFAAYVKDVRDGAFPPVP